MSHNLSYQSDGGIWLSNADFADLVEQLLLRAQGQRLTADQSVEVERLALIRDTGKLWAGRCLDMSIDLKELELPHFWSEQLFGLAVDVLTGRAGEQFEVSRKLALIHGSYSWSHFFGLRATSERTDG